MEKPSVSEKPKFETASSIRARFENLAKITEAEDKRKVEEERRRRQAREQEEKREEARRSVHEFSENATSSTAAEDKKGDARVERPTLLPKGSTVEKVKKFQANFANAAKIAVVNATPRAVDDQRRNQPGKQMDGPASPNLSESPQEEGNTRSQPSEPNTPTTPMTPKTPTFLQSPSEPSHRKKNLPQPFKGDPEEDSSSEFDQSQTNQSTEEKTPTFLQSPPVPTTNKKNLPQPFKETPQETETSFSFENTEKQDQGEQNYSGTKDERSAKNPTDEPSKKASGLTAVAIHNYEAGENDEVSFVRGDAITNIKMVDDDWFIGECKGQVGMFPANHVRMV